MNYSTLLKNLLAEVKSLNRYKEIKKPFNILAFIAVFPFVTASFFISVFYIIFDFIFNGIASCARYLEKWVDEKKKDIHPASEAVLFFITMPTIFFFNVLLSGFALFYYFTWFVLQINLFIATLGGTRWQPYISNAEFAKENEFVIETSEMASLVFSVVAFGLFVIFVIISVFNLELGATLIALYNLGILISVPLIFKKMKVKSSDFESAIDAPGQQ
ncbi:MAG: hypothetical protein IJY65_01615 [Clostridia bacterium]|nr:hypothetical protein [Clostridia bacterium]